MQEKFMKANEVAEILNLSKAMVYRMIQRGELSSLHIGTAVRIRPSDLDAFIADNIKTSKEKLNHL
jgi:excisionase family DNA binding protein